MKTVTAVVLGHGDEDAICRQVASLRQQTRQPDEIIVCACCVPLSEVSRWECVHRFVLDRHQDDTGQRLCDYGLKLATSDYLFFASSDDEYDPRFIEVMTQHDADIIHCDFFSHLNGGTLASTAVRGFITRGSFLVRRSVALDVGYNHRCYDGDGLFINDLKASGATDQRVAEVLYRHL